MRKVLGLLSWIFPFLMLQMFSLRERHGLQPSLFQARTTMLINSGRFRCPSCRHEVVLDRHGVYGLPRNLLVENIIDVYKQEVSNFNNKAASAPPPPPLSAEVTCSDHEGEKVNIYCLTCKVPTCSLCKVFGAHQSCKVAPLTDIYQLQKDELSEEVSSLKSYNEKVQALIDELEQSCRNIEENSKTQKQKVCEQFDHVLSILDERRKAMMEQITSEQEEKTGHAQALIRCYGDSVEANNKLMERATSSMEEPDQAAFVQSSRELMTKVIAAASFSPVETLKPGYESLRQYRFNFSRQERALRSIDFPKLIEEVAEEPEVEPEPEEPTFSTAQITEAIHQEASTQSFGSAAQLVTETLSVISPPVEPVQTAASTPAPVQPLQPAGADLQPETDSLEVGDRPGVRMNQKEKEREERFGAPKAVREENTSEQHEGMTTLQCEGGEGRDWTEQETEEQSDAQDEREIQTDKDTTFCLSFCKPSSKESLSSASEVNNTDQRASSPQLTGDSHPESIILAELEPEPPGSLDSQTQKERAPYPDPPPPGSAPSLEPIRKEDEGDAEEENVKNEGLVCSPGAVDESTDPGEEGFDVGEGSSDSFLHDDYNEGAKPPEETHFKEKRGSSKVEKDGFEIDDEVVEDAEETEQVEDDTLHQKSASDLRERESEKGDFEAKITKDSMKEESRLFGDESAFKEDDVSMSEDGSLPPNETLNDVERTDISTQFQKDEDFEVFSPRFEENKVDYTEETKQPEVKKETRYADSLQMITLLFYLLAFLVILQRAWAYIGIFICI
ncbi:tripartite motif containing 101 isoform X2 [Cheilinus undulatus]|uniref:tripartite motif containing 101 isoform X2 n=1 Tax=Cheilinus undulatus TaxID=241271 RepID=UPI001BD22D9C|nr:tripartite motif containing 101 isoform X2 [Cheilinus undulatus]